MMRFRAVAWCIGVSAATCTLYLISGQVAAERGRLEATETSIAVVHADMKRLDTELGTRASQRQLEQWNGEVLALSTPKANQFLQGKLQLASLDGAVLDRVAGPAQLVAVNATVIKSTPHMLPPQAATPAPARPVPDVVANLHYATYTPEATPVAHGAGSIVRKVALVAPPAIAAPVRSKPLAAKPTMLQSGTLASLAKAARAEGGR